MLCWDCNDCTYQWEEEKGKEPLFCPCCGCGDIFNYGDDEEEE